MPVRGKGQHSEVYAISNFWGRPDDSRKVMFCPFFIHTLVPGQARAAATGQRELVLD